MLQYHNKKGVSIMIGYVLLIVGAVVMGGVVYGWLQSYVPQETLECPSGVSLFIREVQCTADGGGYKLNLDVANNGRFAVDGYFVKVAHTEEQEIATTDISENLVQGGNANAGVVSFPGRALDPGKNAPIAEYGLSDEIYLIELVPIRYEIIGGKSRLVSCSNAKIKEKVIC